MFIQTKDRAFVAVVFDKEVSIETLRKGSYKYMDICSEFPHMMTKSKRVYAGTVMGTSNLFVPNLDWI